MISAYGDAAGKVDAKAAGAIARAIRDGFAAVREGRLVRPSWSSEGLDEAGLRAWFRDKIDAMINLKAGLRSDGATKKARCSCWCCRDFRHLRKLTYPLRQCRDASFKAEGPRSVLPLLREILQGKEQESFVILLLDASFKVSAWREVARGAADHVEIPVRECFRTALLCDARAIILSHNHPSGDPTPSEADKVLTEAMVKAGAYIGCPILDHVVIGDGERYYSFGQGGMGGGSLPTGQRQPPEFDD